MSKSVRAVGAVTAASLLISNMIGTGVFGTTGFLARDLGSPGWILLLWAAGALLALCGAVCYAELGAALPRVGGEYVYLREAFGPLAGFLSGWTSLTIGFGAAIASNATLFAIHLRQLVPELEASAGPWQALLERGRGVELLLVWGLTAVHAAGTERGGALQRGVTALKVGAIGVLLATGFALGQGSWTHLEIRTDAAPPGATTVLVSFLFVSFSYSGWNAVGYIAGELAAPGRTIPRASLWGTLLVALLYLGLNALYLFALPVEALAAAPIEPVAQKSAVALLGPRAGAWITALLCASIAGAASAMVWAGPRVYQAMAQDGVLPRALARTAAGGAPVQAILLQSAWVSVLVLSGTFEALVLYAGFVLLLFTALSVAACIVLRRRRPGLPRPYRAWPWPFAPAVYLAASVALVWACLDDRRAEALWGLLTVAAGLPVYALVRRGSGSR